MNVIEIKDNEFEEMIKNSTGKVLVDCYATWCGPCKMLSPIIDELSEEITDCKFYKIDVDDAQEVATKYNIMSIPTILSFENGELKNQVTGFKTKEEIKEMLGE